ncbi:MAG: hypothetical protein PUH88_05315 [Lachnospiraceae bacterium]|nr:hypothetical protein [Lachnospiraceae bacterium]
MALNLKEKIKYIYANRTKTHFLDFCIKVSIISYFLSFLLLGISAFLPQHSMIRTLVTIVSVIAVICGVLLAGYANGHGIDENAFKEDYVFETEEELKELQEMIDSRKSNL